MGTEHGRMSIHQEFVLSTKYTVLLIVIFSFAFRGLKLSFFGKQPSPLVYAAMNGLKIQRLQPGDMDSVSIMDGEFCETKRMQRTLNKKLPASFSEMVAYLQRPTSVGDDTNARKDGLDGAQSKASTNSHSEVG